MGYKSGRIKVVATPDELGEIKLDDEGIFIPYGVDDINEAAMKKRRKGRLDKDDVVTFRVSKEGFAIDILPTFVRPLRKPKGRSV